MQYHRIVYKSTSLVPPLPLRTLKAKKYHFVLTAFGRISYRLTTPGRTEDGRHASDIPPGAFLHRKISLYRLEEM
ncbi:hypothetical protein SAMN05660226_03616 [Parapedobacter luteus]|uniref:Uncharacterized protein n=1 Tax=Parapedobacter luteus TaxID=623280 RepID=A0A1T5EVP9_9SPHI|nr:hypothetical protein SAMN05660226_03616 [Parapedobacter luteus]